MKKIKTLGLLALVVGMAASAMAAVPKVNTPRDQRGDGAFSDYAGYSHMRNSGSSEMIICSGRCLLKAILMSTGPSTSYISVRNSSVAQGNGALVLPRYTRFFQVASGPGSNNPVSHPILLDKGITVTLSAITSDEDVTVLYLELDD